MDRRLEQGEPVHQLLVLPKLLAVIRGDDEQRVVQHPATFELAHEAAQLGVHRRHLGVVECR